jgi:hypothetical protein
MQAIFLAMGLAVRKGSQVGAFEMVEIEPLLAEWLGLKIPEHIDGQPGWLRKQLR